MARNVCSAFVITNLSYQLQNVPETMTIRRAYQQAPKLARQQRAVPYD